jgi:hypothetical protein
MDATVSAHRGRVVAFGREGRGGRRTDGDTDGPKRRKPANEADGLKPSRGSYCLL